jgi:hypothetical protein
VKPTCRLARLGADASALRAVRCAGSSIHGCNICGKEGHQAAHCPNGTVDWGSKWPREAFSLDEPLWYSEPNYEEVARVARVWVATKRKKLAAAAAKGEAGEVRTAFATPCARC